LHANDMQNLTFTGRLVKPASTRRHFHTLNYISWPIWKG